MYALLVLLADWALFSRFLALPPGRLLVRLILIVMLTMMVAQVGSLVQFLYGDWLFISSWGTRDLFLATTLIKLPFAWVALPRMEFTKFFSLATLGNLAALLIFTPLLWLYPAIVGVHPDTLRDLERQAIDGGFEIRAAIEKFRINHGGQVPAYVFGGDDASWRGMSHRDRLLQEGLLEAYPRNPLHLHRAYMPGRQRWTLPGLFLGQKEKAFETLRTQWLPRVRHSSEPRFGLQGIRMGNQLSDPRVPVSLLPQALAPDQPVPLPGSFLYRAFDLNDDGQVESYVLMVFGAEGSSGLDVFRRSATDGDLALIGPTGSSPDQYQIATDGVPDGVIWVTYGGLLSIPGQSWGFDRP
ncbi:MAG: hypothetical protein GEEBNDBF_00991 [bacterium]|nr:hypothetical protein [bacterium]